jgi:hypothetical protein
MELGDVQNWAASIESDMKEIAVSLDQVIQAQDASAAQSEEQPST